MTDYLLPCILLLAALVGLARKQDIYSAMLDGARDGLKLLMQIVPSLVFLLTAVSMFRASGAIDRLAAWTGPWLSRLGIPSEVLPLMLVRPFSGSAAMAVAAELMASHGPDSPIGRTAAIMLGSTETTFYTISVYFGAAGIRRTRYCIPAALLADFTGFLAAAFFARLFFS